MCTNCGGLDHPATDRDCPQYLRQKQIKAIMANENCAFHEVFLRYPSLNAVKRARKTRNFSPAEFPPLPERPHYISSIPTKSKERPNTPHSAPAMSGLYTEAIKRPKTTIKMSYGTPPSEPRRNVQGYDHTLYNQTLIHHNGRLTAPPGNTFLPIHINKVLAALQEDPRSSEAPDNQNTHSALTHAVDALEAILMASNNPKYNSLAKMIRSTINAPNRTVLLARAGRSGVY